MLALFSSDQPIFLFRLRNDDGGRWTRFVGLTVGSTGRRRADDSGSCGPPDKERRPELVHDHGNMAFIPRS